MAVFPLLYNGSLKSLRFYRTGAATGAFSGNEWLFTQPDDSTKQAWCTGMRLTAAAGATLEFSFDGTNVHLALAAGESADFLDRHEGGIAVRGAGTFYIEAW